VTSLGRCVGNDAQFLAEHWGRAPLHLAGIDAGGFADLLSLDDVDQLIASSFLRLPAIRLVRDGTPLDPATYTRSARLGNKDLADVADPGRVYERFREGATIVLQGLHRSWPPLTRFCRELELELTHPVQVNAYITPPAAQGLAVHYDTHDVFVLQFGGTKQWSIHDPVLEDPLASQPWSSSRGRSGDAIRLRRSGDVISRPGMVAAELADELKIMASWLELGAVSVAERGDLAPLLRRSLGKAARDAKEPPAVPAARLGVRP